MTSKKHFLISILVTFLVAILFAFFTKDLQQHVFKLNENFQLVPKGFEVPRGCDIRMDMQTGQIWAKLAVMAKSNESLIPIETENEEIKNNKNNKNGAPEYKNLTKSRIQSRYSYGSTAERIESALKFETEDSWNSLEEEAPALEVGLGILESKNFVNLRIKISNASERALNILSMCLQNNPLAVERAIEIGLLENEIISLLSREDLNLNVYQKLLKIIESFLKFNQPENAETLLLKIKTEIKRQNFVHGNNLNERSLEIIRLIN